MNPWLIIAIMFTNGDFAFDAKQKIVFIPMWAVC